MNNPPTVHNKQRIITTWRALKTVTAAAREAYLSHIQAMESTVKEATTANTVHSNRAPTEDHTSISLCPE